MIFHFESDAPGDVGKFEADFETERMRNGFPPIEVSWFQVSLEATVNNPNVPEAQLRKLISLALGRQERTLK